LALIILTFSSVFYAKSAVKSLESFLSNGFMNICCVVVVEEMLRQGHRLWRNMTGVCEESIKTKK